MEFTPRATSRPAPKSDRGDRPGFKNDRGDRPGFKSDRGDRPGFKNDRGDRPGFKNDRGDRPGFKSERKPYVPGSGRGPRLPEEDAEIINTVHMRSRKGWKK